MGGAARAILKHTLRAGDLETYMRGTQRARRRAWRQPHAGAPRGSEPGGLCGPCGPTGALAECSVAARPTGRAPSDAAKKASTWEMKCFSPSFSVSQSCMSLPRSTSSAARGGERARAWLEPCTHMHGRGMRAGLRPLGAEARWRRISMRRGKPGACAATDRAEPPPPGPALPARQAPFGSPSPARSPVQKEASAFL